MLRWAAIAAALLGTVLSVNVVLADDRSDCFSPQPKAEDKVATCTRVIEQSAADQKTQSLAYFNRGISQLRLKQYQACIDDYSEGIKIRTTDGLAYYNRGLCYANLRERDKAIADYQAALRLDPANVTWMHDLGYSYGAKRDYKSAIETYT